jgi:hypothetical protein
VTEAGTTMSDTFVTIVGSDTVAITAGSEFSISQGLLAKTVLRLTDTGITFKHTEVTIEASKFNLATAVFNVPVDQFTVDGPNGVKFEILGDSGDTVIRGDVTIGGHDVESCMPAAATVPPTDCTFTAGDRSTCPLGCTYITNAPGDRTVNVQSQDENVLAIFSAAGSDKDAILRLTDKIGGNGFDLMKDDTIFKIQAENAEGIIEINPGTSGSLHVNTDKLVVDGATGDTGIRGDVTVGGASVTGVREQLIQSNDDAVALKLVSGGPGQEASVQVGDGTNTFAMTASTRFMRIEAHDADGRLEIKPGATGRLTIGPDAGPNVVIDTATAYTDMDGGLNVEGVSSLNQLDIESGTGTGNSLETIDKATGFLTSDPTELPTFMGSVGGDYQTETVVLNNNRVKVGSVVLAAVVGQCNSRTMVTVTAVATRAQTIEFTTANLGSEACAKTVAEPLGQTYQIAFVVLN